MWCGVLSWWYVVPVKAWLRSQKLWMFPRTLVRPMVVLFACVLWLMVPQLLVVPLFSTNDFFNYFVLVLVHLWFGSWSTLYSHSSYQIQITSRPTLFMHFFIILRQLCNFLLAQSKCLIWSEFAINTFLIVALMPNPSPDSSFNMPICHDPRQCLLFMTTRLQDVELLQLFIYHVCALMPLTV
jgi:hypothetical protein